MGVDVTRIQECAEAVSGGLHKTGLFEWLGDTDGGHSTWFTCGVKPDVIRVEVQRSKLHTSVAVNVEWPVLIGREVKHGHQTMRINCGANYNRKAMEVQAEHAVRRCLEIYRDVLEKKGVADPATVTRVMTAEANAPVENDFDLGGEG